MAKILIADDEPNIVTLISRYAEREGYEVTGVSDGRQAIEACRNDSFDVVIWDNKNGAMIKKDKISQNIEMFNSNHIDIDFSLKGSSRKVKTRVFDNSSYYDALEPIVRNYFEAFRKNQELKKG